MENKKIYLWNEVPEGILFDEISGFSPVIINGDLDLVKYERYYNGKEVIYPDKLWRKPYEL